MEDLICDTVTLERDQRYLLVAVTLELNLSSQLGHLFLRLFRKPHHPLLFILP